MIALLLAAFLSPQRIETDAGCVTCHEGQLDDWKGSIHEKHLIGCVRCHGADSVDTARSRPHLGTAGFRRGTKRANPALCAGCHKAEFEAYDRSAHAEDARDPSGKVKGCVSCHGFHDTSAADRRAILKEACATCHKAGTAQLRRGESYVALVDGLPRDGALLKALRVAQHEASHARYAEIERQASAAAAAAGADAYNTKDPGSPPPWPAAVVALVGVAALSAWGLRQRRRQAT